MRKEIPFLELSVTVFRNNWLPLAAISAMPNEFFVIVLSRTRLSSPWVNVIPASELS